VNTQLWKMALILTMVFPRLLDAVSELTAEEFHCQGSYWNYQYIFSQTIKKGYCKYRSIQTKEWPGHPIAKKKPNFYLLTINGCWESLARIQIDGAKCCIASGSILQQGGPRCKKTKKGN